MAIVVIVRSVNIVLVVLSCCCLIAPSSDVVTVFTRAVFSRGARLSPTPVVLSFLNEGLLEHVDRWSADRVGLGRTWLVEKTCARANLAPTMRAIALCESNLTASQAIIRDVAGGAFMHLLVAVLRYDSSIIFISLLR